MKKSICFILLGCVALAVTFWMGTRTGRYMSSVERESQYPFDLREIWVNNQPTCDDYKTLNNGKKPILIDTVKDGNNLTYIKVVSRPTKTSEGNILYSILNTEHEQYIDELWLNCK